MLSRIFARLFDGAPQHLMVLPLIALFLFVAIFVMVVVRTMRRGSGHYAPIAALPLAREERP